MVEAGGMVERHWMMVLVLEDHARRAVLVFDLWVASCWKDHCQWQSRKLWFWMTAYSGVASVHLTDEPTIPSLPHSSEHVRNMRGHVGVLSSESVFPPLRRTAPDVAHASSDHLWRRRRIPYNNGTETERWGEQCAGGIRDRIG